MFLRRHQSLDVAGVGSTDSEPISSLFALHLKADMCGALSHVCFGPKADIQLAMRTPISVARRIRPWGYGLNKKCVPGHSRYMRGVNNGDRAVNY